MPHQSSNQVVKKTVEPRDDIKAADRLMEQDLCVMMQQYNNLGRQTQTLGTGSSRNQSRSLNSKERKMKKVQDAVKKVGIHFKGTLAKLTGDVYRWRTQEKTRVRRETN